MQSTPLHTTPTRRGSSGGAARATEYEFQRLTLPREFSKSFVTRLLVDRAEHGGWELDRVHVSPDGTRRVVLRRKIIRMRPTLT